MAASYNDLTTKQFRHHYILTTAHRQHSRDVFMQPANDLISDC